MSEKQKTEFKKLVKEALRCPQDCRFCDKSPHICMVEMRKTLNLIIRKIYTKFKDEKELDNLFI